ncbi:MAG: hypothetical protein EZS28_040091 [Streblomastix strix]|uniref:Uncharacterized protein n=1 Tax=Streblomastix strix TaxID=222440 RepID=A0A5J4U362_9EUKA|nr:MAG: hypothetical protein EZS28_040091 [Streblomastix strix]
MIQVIGGSMRIPKLQDILIMYGIEGQWKQLNKENFEKKKKFEGLNGAKLKTNQILRVFDSDDDKAEFVTVQKEQRIIEKFDNKKNNKDIIINDNLVSSAPITLFEHWTVASRIQRDNCEETRWSDKVWKELKAKGRAENEEMKKQGEKE